MVSICRYCGKPPEHSEMCGTMNMSTVNSAIELEEHLSDCDRSAFRHEWEQMRCDWQLKELVELVIERRFDGHDPRLWEEKKGWDQIGALVEAKP